MMQREEKAQTNPNQSERRTGEILGFILKTSGKTKVYVAILLLVQGLLGISSVFYALFLKQIFDAAALREGQRFFRMSLGLVLLVLLQLLFNAMVRFLQEYAISYYENILKGRLFGGLLLGDYEQVHRVHSGEWMNRLTGDTVVVAEGTVTILPGVVGMGVKLLSAMAVLLYMVPRFAYILIPGGLLLLVLTYAFRKVMKKLHKNMREKDGLVRIFMQDHLSSLMVVKAFGRENRALDEAGERMRIHRSARMKKNHFSNLCNVGFGGVMNGAYVLGVIYGGMQIMSGAMTYGTLIAILQLIGQVQSPFANLTMYLPKYYAALASAERLMDVDAYGEEDVRGLEADYRDFTALNMNHVFFEYDDHEEELPKEAFANLTFSVQRGEMVAFTGPSGCGKSTALKLLMAMYRPGKGTVTVTSADGRQIPILPAARCLFAYVPQGNQLMSGSIREVVTFGQKADTVEDALVWEALHTACADDFVRELDTGLDYSLGENGNGLSEGQMQRIAIARAIYSKRPVLLLDEATSSLDEATEYSVLKRLHEVSGQTVIIVTHRPAALAFADRQIMFGCND